MPMFALRRIHLRRSHLSSRTHQLRGARRGSGLAIHKEEALRRLVHPSPSPQSACTNLHLSISDYRASPVAIVRAVNHNSPSMVPNSFDTSDTLSKQCWAEGCQGWIAKLTAISGRLPAACHLKFQESSPAPTFRSLRRQATAILVWAFAAFCMQREYCF